MRDSRLADIPGPLPFHGACTPALAGDAASVAYPVFRAPFDCKLIKFSVIPQAAVTAHATNRKDLNLINAGTDGTGTTAIASFDMDTPTTDDLAAMDEKVIYAPTDPHSGVNLSQGDVLKLEIEDNGTSPVFPALMTYIEIMAR